MRNFSPVPRRSWRGACAGLALSLAWLAPAQALIVSSNSDGVDNSLSLRLCQPSYLTGPTRPICTSNITGPLATPRGMALEALSSQGWEGVDAQGTPVRLGPPKTRDEAEAYQEVANLLDFLDVEFVSFIGGFNATLKVPYRGSLLLQVRSTASSAGLANIEHYLFEGLDAPAGARFTFNAAAFDGGVRWVNALVPVSLPASLPLALLALGLGAAVTRRRRQSTRA